MTRIRALRKEKNLTQLQIRMRTGIDQSNLSKLERGKRTLSFNECEQLAIALDTSMDYLAGLTDVKDPYPRGEDYKKKYPAD